MARDVIRQQHQNFKQTFDTSIGKVLVDDITIIEVSKGSATDNGYFLKQEIAKNIDKYIDKMRLIEPNEPIDLGHNRPNSKYYRRKTQFSNMRVYVLTVGDVTFEIKFGQFNNGKGLNLYHIKG